MFRYLILLILIPNLVLAHPADSFCSFYRDNNQIPNIAAYEAADLIGGAVLANKPDGTPVFVDIDNPGDAVIVLNADGDPAIEHCEWYISYLCHDDLDFVKALKGYWHWRRLLLHEIHAGMESRARTHIYSHLRGNNVGVRPEVAGLDFGTPEHFDTNFRDYWLRIIRSPETQACAMWRSGTWTRQAALDYLNAHEDAAKAHHASANRTAAELFVSEVYIHPFEPAWCLDPRAPGTETELANRRNQAWFVDHSVTDPRDLLDIN